MTAGPNPKVLVIALDGADWSIIEPLLDQGQLPALASLLARPGAARAVLESTIPPVTFPAWTTFLTGVNPGRHGVLDFARRLPGSYELRFSGGDARRAPTILEHLAEAGRRVASLGLPGTWPPMELRGGFVLSGFDAPVAIGPGPDFARPRDLYERVVAEHGPWVYADVDELKVGRGWHSGARARLLAGLERKSRIARAIMAEAPWDLFLVHIGETDTAGHHFFAHHDPKSPRRPPNAPGPELRTIADVYRAADRLIGELSFAAGEGAAVLVASDHGMEGASDRVFHPNRALEREGLLCFERGAAARRVLGRAESLVRGTMLRLLPARLKESLVRRFRGVAGAVESRRRLEGIDLYRTVAFSEELTYAPSVRLNVRDREPLGVVLPEEVDSVTELVASALLSLSDPEDGARVVERVWRREEVLAGPALPEAPDLYFQAAAPGGYRYTVLSSAGTAGPFTSRLRGEAKLGGKGRGPTGVHRRDGVLVVSPAGSSAPRDGPSPPSDLGTVPIGACAPTLMALCGLPPPEGMEWSSLVGDLRPEAMPLAASPRHSPSYTPEQEAVVASRLRSLGYLD